MRALSLEQAWSKPKTLIVTTVIGLSWFVIAIASYSVARALFPHSLHGELIFANASLIILGYTLYLFGVPLLFDSRRELLSFWRRIGFFYFDRKSVVMFSLFVILTLIIGGASGEIQKQFGNQTLPIITSIEPPLVEELMFRGIILTLLLRTYSRWFAILWSSLLFAFIHIELGGEYMIMAFLGALIVFSVLRIQSKSIWSGAFAHFAMIKGLAGATLVSFVVLELVLLCSRLIRVVRGSGC